MRSVLSIRTPNRSWDTRLPKDNSAVGTTKLASTLLVTAPPSKKVRHVLDQPPRIRKRGQAKSICQPFKRPCGDRDLAARAGRNVHRPSLLCSPINVRLPGRRPYPDPGPGTRTRPPSSQGFSV